MSVYVQMERLTTTHCVIDNCGDKRIYDFFKNKIGEFDDGKRYFFNYSILNELKKYIETFVEDDDFAFSHLDYILSEIEDELELASKDTAYIVWRS